jgi:hypothetical protein
VRSFEPSALSRITRAGSVVKLVLGSSEILVAHKEDNSLHTYTVNGVRLCSTDAGEKLNDIAAAMITYSFLVATGAPC